MNPELRWRPIPGYEGLYEVSDQGDVFSHVSRRLLRQFITAKGYAKVHLHRDKQDRGWRVHRLVLIAFDREPKEGEVARHLNGDASDNRAENLAWGTVLENAQDMIRHGTNWQTQKTHCPAGHSYEEHGRTARLKAEKRPGYWNLRRCTACQRERYARRVQADTSAAA